MIHSWGYFQDICQITNYVWGVWGAKRLNRESRRSIAEVWQFHHVERTTDNFRACQKEWSKRTHRRVGSERKPEMDGSVLKLNQSLPTPSHDCIKVISFCSSCLTEERMNIFQKNKIPSRSSTHSYIYQTSFNEILL